MYIILKAHFYEIVVVDQLFAHSMFWLVQLPFGRRATFAPIWTLYSFMCPQGGINVLPSSEYIGAPTRSIINR